jgi:ubiquinone/menaquinone biosynthesis C-methylase UbiE
MEPVKLYGFTHVDQTADPRLFIRFLDEACAQESFQAYKQRSYSLLKLGPGQKVLDVACGTGDDARTMAGLVAPSGQVIGIDGSQTMIEEAQRRAAGATLPVEFRLGDGQRLEFGDNSFDAARCDRSFMHMEQPRRALAEMIRVTKPGGRVLVYEVDFEMVVIDAPDKPLCRKVVNTWCDGFRDGWLGRRIPAWFPEAGLEEVEVVPATLRLTPSLTTYVAGPDVVARGAAAGTLTEAEARAWLSWLEQAVASQRLFATLTGFLVVGRKP